MAGIGEVNILCGYCDKKFPSGIFVADTETFDSMTTAGNKQQCPLCGKMVNLNKENMSYVLADDSGGSVGPDFGGNKG